MPDINPEDIEQARSLDVHPGTFDDSSYKLLRKFISHDEITGAMEPTEARRGVGVPVEYLQTSLANNNGDLPRALDEAEALIDRDYIQAATNRNVYTQARNSPITAYLSSNLLSQSDHDDLCDLLSGHQAVLGSRSDDLGESTELFEQMTPITGDDSLIDRVSGWNNQNYRGAHNWMQSEIGKLKSDGVIHAGKVPGDDGIALLSEHDLFKRIHRSIHRGEKLNINYRGVNDSGPVSRTIAPTAAWFHPENRGLYVRAYDPDAITEGVDEPGGWRTFRGGRMLGATPAGSRDFDLPEDNEAEMIASGMRTLHNKGGVTSLLPPREGISQHCSCPNQSSRGLHTVECYQNMAEKLINHYTAQLVSSCVNPVAGEDPSTISPETLKKFISTRRKRDIAIKAAESALYPVSYSQARHG